MNNYSAELLSNINGKKIIITGYNGYIGNEVANQLDLNNIDYIGLDKTEISKINCLQFNLSDRKKLKEVIIAEKPDYIFHTATHSALAYKNDFINVFQEDNLVLSNIISSLRKTNNTQLIYFSSSYVYSGLDINDTVSEKSILAPIHNFGLAKSFFEQMILRVHPNSIIFRLSSVFGQGNYLHPNAIEVMAQEAMNDKFLTIWGKGMRKMQYVFLEDVVKYILKGTKLLPGIYNLAGNNYETVDATATYIADYFGTITKKLPEKNEGETLPFMDNDKLINALGHENFSNHRISLTQYLSDISN